MRQWWFLALPSEKDRISPMNASTTAPFEAIFGKDLGHWFLDMIGNGTIQAYQLIWGLMIKPLLLAHWFSLLLLLLFLFIVLFFEAMMGKWGAFGSLTYNTLYFGALLAVILIWGVEVLVGDFFNFACAVILYPVCYLITGKIIDKFGFRR